MLDVYNGQHAENLLLPRGKNLAKYQLFPNPKPNLYIGFAMDLGDSINESLHTYAQNERLNPSLCAAINSAVTALNKLQHHRNSEVCHPHLLLHLSSMSHFCSWVFFLIFLLLFVQFGNLEYTRANSDPQLVRGSRDPRSVKRGSESIAFLIVWSHGNQSTWENSVFAFSLRLEFSWTSRHMGQSGWLVGIVSGQTSSQNINCIIAPDSLSKFSVPLSRIGFF